MELLGFSVVDVVGVGENRGGGDEEPCSLNVVPIFFEGDETDSTERVGLNLGIFNELFS